MKRLYVFYDGECGLCGQCRQWLATQPVYLSLIFFPFQSKEALQICPYLPYLKPDQQLIVQSDEGGIYLGERAWLICLYAARLPRLVPATGRACASPFGQNASACSFPTIASSFPKSCSGCLAAHWRESSRKQRHSVTNDSRAPRSRRQGE